MDSNGNKEGMAEVLDKDASQAVQVAVNIRPLIALERVQGCKECISVVPGEPQVQLGSHSFTFDHVYGTGASAPSAVFDECVRPLVEGLFHGYNATVLAYGQTGSGKTYTMGTGYTVGGSTEGIIPQVMETIFKKIGSLNHKADFQLRVSFIEILKEEVHDLLDPNPPSAVKPEMTNGGPVKNLPLGKPPIQIRETGSGGIILAGVTETEVRNLPEMAACLEQGSLCRATGSTNMNSQSSRSHAIFTINVEQRRKWDAFLNGDTPLPEDTGEDFLCAKLHLVDLAGSERAKRTKADGNRFKEGVHINKGLLALGNVISALGDDKKRKEGGHVPYRDSKLTRLLQDSLGGNSRTVMIACVSPADSNAEETLNTLKYANRARNIQNKPTVNRDPMAAEMQRMRQQLELLQGELLCARATSVPEEIQILKQKVAWLETSNMELRHELQQSNAGCAMLSQQALDVQVERDTLQLKLQKLRSGKAFPEVEEDETQSEDLLKGYLAKIQELEIELQRVKARAQLTDIERRPLDCLETNASDLCSMSLEELSGDPSVVGEEDVVAVKELEHTMLQDCLDKELQELNKRLELKEAEMKSFARPDNVILKQHFEKKLMDLEEEKKSLQKERDALLKHLEVLATSSDEHAQKMQETYVQKLKDLEHQISELKKKQENQAQLLRQKQRSDEAAKRLQEDIQRIKQQKVQLQNKIKQESEQFRAWKNLREKEVLQLRKEGRRNEYEMHKLQALHQRQKMVLQRKTEEAAAATRRLKELLEARRVSSRDSASGSSSQNNEKALQQWLDQELEVVVRVHEVRTAYEKQSEARAAMAKELARLKQEEQAHPVCQNGTALSPQQKASSAMSPSARRARIGLIESMLNASSSALVAMASQLSEAEERERAFSGRARWQNLRTIGDLRNMLNLCFNTASFARCQLRDKEVENKELKEKTREISEALKQSEAHRVNVERQQRLKEQAVAVALATASKAGADAAVQRGVEELSLGLSQLAGTGRKLQYGDGGSDLAYCGANGIPYDLRKVSRGLPSYKGDGSDSSEWEADMEIDEADQSDKDWDEEDERYAARTRRNWKKSSITGRKSSFTSSSQRSDLAGTKATAENHSDATDEIHSGQELPTNTPDELGSNPSSDVSSEDGEQKPKPSSASCCTCSQSSGCKTKKCECRLGGGLCGANCTCKANKCANREPSELEDDVASVLGSDVAGTSTSHDPSEVTMRADELLAKHGAKLLDRAFKEEVTVQDLPEGAVGGETVERTTKQRRPLSDIGNTKVTIAIEKPAKQRRKVQKTLVQIVPAPQQPSNPQPDAPVQSSTASVPLNASESNERTNNPPPRQQSAAQTSGPSPHTSPLRARNRHRNGGRDDPVKRLGGSPKKPGDEKENIR